jgi:hypothetical protein
VLGLQQHPQKPIGNDGRRRRLLQRLKLSGKDEKKPSDWKRRPNERNKQRQRRATVDLRMFFLYIVSACS